MEVLAPAGSPEAARAALRGGADAVYLGYGDFNARRNAKNFTKDELRETAALCHQNRVAVHVALNTLVFEGEEERALQTAQEAAEAGADTFIVQDLGLVSLLKRHLPHIPLHGSTQLSVHNVAGARFLWECGFARAVLAREMSLAEIQAVHEALPELELEIFVHGALCMSVSGQCLLSAVLGGRSGNRGLCAQTCRLPFAAAGQSHALSLKDMSYVPHLPALMEAGVVSLKIEGRMKRPEYAAIASLAVRRGADGLPEEEEVSRLLKNVFSRSGFTDGYLTAKRGRDMFGVRTKEDTKDTAEALSQINRLTRGMTPRLPLDLTLTAKENSPVTLSVADGVTGETVTVTGETAVPAEKPANIQRMKESLSRLGGTPYYGEKVDVTINGNPFVPVSEINRLRREAMDTLTARVTARPPKGRETAALPCYGRATWPFAGGTVLRLESPSLLPNLDGSRGCGLWFPLQAILKDPDTVAALVKSGHPVAAELPRFIATAREQEVVAALKKAALLHVTAGVCGNVGHLVLVREAGLVPVGGVGLNVANGETDRLLREMGVPLRTLSPEVSLRKNRFAGNETLLFAYGRLPVMLVRNCPMGGQKGCGDCKAGGKGGVLRDRKETEFPLICRQGHAELLNSCPVWTADKPTSLPRLLYFTVETREETADVLAAYQSGRPADGAFTRGISSL